jgi:type II secretory pathway pseudopilin PulG
MRSRGFTYLTVLFVVAIMGAGLALVSEVWHTASMHEKEVELLFAGNQYRKAIERYCLSGAGQYPRSLEDLLRDARKPDTVRHLRRMYPDPMTGTSEWGIVRAPDGGIMGVRTTSNDKPFKTAGFRLRDRAFEGAAKYSDWIFAYSPTGQPATQKPPPR